VACQLNSSGSSLRPTEVTTVPATAMLRVRDSEIATERFYVDLKGATDLYYRQYFSSPSEHCAFTLWLRGGLPTETDQRCGVITLVTTFTGNPAENTHSKNRTTRRLFCLFGNSMEYSALCDVLIDQVMLNYVIRFTVTVRMLAAGHSHNICYYYVVRFWTVFKAFKQ
jgi:hypothetical protein